MKLNDVNNRINEKITVRKWYHRVTAITIVFSLLCAFFVPLDLVKPGMAITSNNLNDGVDYFDGPYSGSTAGFTDYTNFITGKFTVGQQQEVTIKGDSAVIDAADADPASIRIEFNYELDKDDLTGLLSTPFAYYQLDSKLVPQNNYSGSTLSFTDPDWNDGLTTAGYYSINTSGLIVFHYTSDYINYLAASNGMTGSIYFNAKVDRNEDERGDQTFEFGKTEVTLKFDDTKPEISKSGSVVHEGDNYYIDWTVTIDETTGYVDMSTYSFADVLNDSPIDWSQQSYNVEPVDSMYLDGTTLKFKQYGNDEQKPKHIILTYRTSSSLGASTTNKSTLTKGDISIPAEYPVTIENGVTVTKKGTPDYEIQSGANDKIQWEIDVKHKQGDSLNNVVLTEQNSGTFGSSDNVTVYDINGNVIDKSKYTVDGATLTFANDSTIPSEVKVVFWGNAISGWNNNSVVASRPDFDETSGQGGINYSRNLSLVKQLNGLNQDTGTFEWQFTLSTIQNAKESLNEYTITDEAFKKLSSEQVASLGYNAYFGNDIQVNSQDDTKNKYGFQITKTSDDTIKISFNEDDAAYNKDRPLNTLKLYYNTTIQDYLSSTDYEKYQNGQKVGLYNQASAKNKNDTLSADSGKVGRDIQQRIEANKSYSGNAYESVLGNENTADRILNWSVSMVKDTGFQEGNEYYDVFIGESDVPHYIAPDQRSYITSHIEGAVTTGENNSRGNTTPLTSEMYEVKFYKDSNLTQEAGVDENAVGFKVIFKSNSTLASYHHVYIDYQTTAKTSAIRFGQQVAFSNNYTFNGVPKTTPGLTFKRENPNEVQNVHLNLNKKWSDNKNALGTRPDSITVKVLQAEAGEDGNLPASPTWVPYPNEDGFTLAASDASEEDNFTLDYNFPRWKYDADHDKITYYYYKIQEEPVTGYTLTANLDTVKAESDKTFTLTNTSTTNFGKVAVDSSGNRITQVNLSDSSAVPVETINIDGTPTKCYMFSWRIFLTPADITSVYTDILPTNAVYVSGSESGLSNYVPKAYYSDTQYFLINAGWQIMDITQNNNLLSIRMVDNRILFLDYYTAIPVSLLETSLDAEGNLINKVSKEGGTPFEATLKVNGEMPDVESEPITKSAEAAGQGVIKYSIDFNPTGKKLSGTGTVDITDALTYLGGTRKSGGQDVAIPLDSLSFELEKIDMFSLVDGEPDLSNSIKSQLGYTIDYGATIEQRMDVSKWSKFDSNGTKWRTADLSPGDRLHLKLKYPSSSSNNELHFFAKLTNQYNTYGNNKGEVAYNYNALQLDESGIVEVDISVPTSSEANVYELNDYQSPFEILSATITKDAPALLTLTVPDETPVHIEYSYRIEGWEPNSTGNPANDDVIKFGNLASFASENGDGDSSVDENRVNTSGAKVNAKRYPTIYKTEYGNDNLDYLSASFAVAKYDVESNKWVYLQSIKTITTDEGTINEKSRRELTFPDSPYTGYLESNDTYPANTALLKFAKEDDASTANDKENIHEFDLHNNTLYKFVEIVAPPGYTQPNWTNHTLTDNMDFVFYYAYDDFDQTKAPSEAEGHINIINAGKRVNIKNSKNIKVNVEKTFSGSDGVLPVQSEVTFKLYWANNKKGTGMKLVTRENINVASDFDPVRTIPYKTSNETNSASWNDLPTGYMGSAVYYFVREYSYKDKNGTLYTYDESSGKYLNNGHEGPFKPVYTGNGTNVDESTVNVNNSEGIVVKKLWVDLDGRPVPPAKEVGSDTDMAVGFTVYGVQGSNKIKLDLPVKTLSSSNNYQYILPTTVQDEEGNSYELTDFENFEIKENLTEEQRISMYAKYLAPQTNRIIENGTGVLEIINTDISSDTTNAVVQKVWKDGGVDHSNDTLTMMLVQSSTADLTDEQLMQIAGDTAITGVNTGSSIQSSDAVKLIEKGHSITLTFENDITSVSGLPTGVTESHEGKNLTLNGNSITNGDITITFANEATKEITVSVIDYEVTLGKQEDESVVWKHTWTALPYSDGDNNYYYYVVEKAVPNDYTVTYNRTTTSAGQTTTITNSLPTELTVQKIWLDAEGNTIITNPTAAGYDSVKAGALPDSIQVQVYQKLKEETIAGELHLDKPTSIKVAAYGDSITKGTINNIAEAKTYPNVLQSAYLTSENGYSSSTVYKIAESGRLIDDIKNQIQYDSNISTADIICVIAGTNDIINSNVAVTSESGDSLETKMRQLIEGFIGDNGANQNAILMIGKIPRFTALTWSNSRNIEQAYGKTAAQEAEIQAQWDTLVASYNTMLTNLVNEYKQQGKKIMLVDVYTAVGDNLVDGCHPNEAGYQAIANAFYTEINKIYVGADATTREIPTDISMPGNDADISSQFSGTLYGTYTLEKSNGYQLGISDLPEKNSLGVDYVYYIKEVGTHVLDSGGTFYTISGDSNKYISAVTYEHNGQLAADSGTVTIRNTIKTAELKLQKVWDDENDHTGDSITVRVHRDTVADSNDARQNPLILTMDVARNGTLLLPIGSTTGIQVTANKAGILGQTGTLELVSSTSGLSSKTWTIKPGTASVGDEITMTFTDGDNQTYSFKVKIVDNPVLTLSISDGAPALDDTAPTLTLKYTPSGETEYVVTSGATYEVLSGNSVSVTSDDGTITLLQPGESTIQASYQGMKDTVVVNVGLPKTFSVSPVTVVKEDSAGVLLTPNPNFGTFTYSVNEGYTDKISVNANGIVTGSVAGTYENAVRVTRDDDKYVDVNVNVIENSTINFTMDQYGNYKYYLNPSEQIPAGSTVSIVVSGAQAGKLVQVALNDQTSMCAEEYADQDGMVTLNITVNTATTLEHIDLWNYKSDGWNEGSSDLDKSELKLESYTVNNSSSGSDSSSSTLTEKTTVKLDDSIKSITLRYNGNAAEWPDAIIKFTDDVYVKIGMYPLANYDLIDGLFVEANNSKIDESYLPSHSTGELWGNTYYYSFNGDNTGTTLTITFPDSLSVDQFEVTSWKEGSNTSIEYSVIYATDTIQSANSRQILSRFNAANLRLSAALEYTALPLNIEAETPTPTESANFNESGYMDITLTSSNSWQKQLTGLPVYKVNADGTLQSYYYWAEEIKVNGMPVAGYTVSYSFTDGDSETDYSINAANPGSNPLITIKNTPTESPSSVELPESGSTGTKIYYVFGGILLMLAAAGYTYSKRRRWSDE